MARLDHANARVGARRSRLLGAAGLRELLARPSLAAQLELLVRAGRLPPPAAEPAGAPLEEVERALRDGVRRDEARLLGEIEGEGPRRLFAAALGLEDARAVKVLLRGVATGAPPERLLSLAPPAHGLPDRALRSLATASSPEALAAALGAIGSPFAAPLAASLRDRDRVGLLPAELAVDRAAFARLASAARGRGEDAAALAGWVADRVDARNASTLLALGGGAPLRDLFVPGGGRLGAAAFQRLAREGPEARRAAAAALVPCAPDRLAAPWLAERALARAVVRRLTLAARRAPLSLAVPLAWVEERREEVARIAAVLRGSAMGLPGDTLIDVVEA